MGHPRFWFSESSCASGLSRLLLPPVYTSGSSERRSCSYPTHSTKEVEWMRHPRFCCFLRSILPDVLRGGVIHIPPIRQKRSNGWGTHDSAASSGLFTSGSSERRSCSYPTHSTKEVEWMGHPRFCCFLRSITSGSSERRSCSYPTHSTKEVEWMGLPRFKAPIELLRKHLKAWRRIVGVCRFKDENPIRAVGRGAEFGCA